MKYLKDNRTGKRYFFNNSVDKDFKDYIFGNYEGIILSNQFCLVMFVLKKRLCYFLSKHNIGNKFKTLLMIFILVGMFLICGLLGSVEIGVATYEENFRWFFNIINSIKSWF